ncbi:MULTISPECIES: cytosine permease [Streptomyces]|uniref:cytosine permease n=1 Tax=Streptomyces TaxID=1883 RepID=UPI00035D4AF8|nr:MULTISPECIES: cytosine permease [unclassified Streptomyces]WSX90735.1 cytosine permease [Streptomyces sp. NBC_00891]WSY05216.1 cytosine permease [Streptomyces sp. NBC_00890]WSZ06840.1 cytosine permease [Streptomyces sp. NBC_00869]WSZ25661.1 cytosine permease [Streptomyces sp. NBC_00870]MYS35063.1 cytosine permease [Streptomyces sp. SID4920]
MAATPQSGAVASAPKSIGSDDYSLSRVPRDQRFGFWSMLLQWLAQSGSISQFTLGATIGVGMTFGDAFLAFTLGAVILEVVIFAIGLAGMREGLATPMLTRWVGFGRNGSALVSFVIAVSLVGWFGVQNKIFGDSVSALVGGPAWMWCVLAGIAITALVIFGFKYMANFAKIVTPLFFAMVAFSVIRTLNDHSFGDLVHSPPPGDTIPLAVAATAIAGGYMTGAIVSPEMTRYNRKGSHVFLQSASSMILSEYIVGLTGVLLGHLVKSNEVSHIVLSTSGAFGVLVVLMSTAKINDWNLYGSSLGVVNFFQVVFGKRVHRGAVTIVLGIAGTVLSAVGIMSHFTEFLTILGVAIPPIGGIIVAEYWVVKRMRKPLDETREAQTLPAHSPTWVPMSIVIWIAAFCVGKFYDGGIPALNSLATAFVLYSALGLLGWIKPYGTSVLADEQDGPAPDARTTTPVGAA